MKAESLKAGDSIVHNGITHKVLSVTLAANRVDIRANTKTGFPVTLFYLVGDNVSKAPNIQYADNPCSDHSEDSEVWNTGARPWEIGVAILSALILSGFILARVG